MSDSEKPPTEKSTSSESTDQSEKKQEDAMAEPTDILEKKHEETLAELAKFSQCGLALLRPVYGYDLSKLSNFYTDYPEYAAAFCDFTISYGWMVLAEADKTDAAALQNYRNLLSDLAKAEMLRTPNAIAINVARNVTATVAVQNTSLKKIADAVWLSESLHLRTEALQHSAIVAIKAKLELGQVLLAPDLLKLFQLRHNAIQTLLDHGMLDQAARLDAMFEENV